MASSLSEEEFQRLQSQLLDLRSANYTLEERHRRQQYEIATLQEKLEALDKEYQKSVKALNKSRKAKEVELLLQDNENLQLKLQSQEDEFRLQNTTLMQELSLLVSSNEKLEREIKSFRDGQPASVIQESSEIIKLQDEIRRLQAENVALQKTLTDVKTKQAEEVETLRETLRKMTDVSLHLDSQDESNTSIHDESDRLLQQTEAEESGVVHVGEQEVSFRKSLNTSVSELLQHSENKIESLENQLREYGDLKIKIEIEQEENRLLRGQLETMRSSQQNHSSNLQEEMENLKGKLKKKQESLMQLQAEKEQLYKDSRQALDELQANKDQEIQQLKELAQRLQTQLNNSTQNFQEHREKMNAVIQELEERLAVLQSEVNSQTADKLKELEADKIILNNQLTELQKNFDSLKQEKDDISLHLQQLIKLSDELSKEVQQLTEENKALSASLEESKKVAEKRKSLLDEMAIHLQKKADEHQQEVIRLTEEYTETITKLSRSLEDEKLKTDELEEKVSKTEDLETEVKSLETTKKWFEQRLNEAEAEIVTSKAQFEETLKETANEQALNIKQIQEEYEAQIQDLQTQLEISNAQKVEYEESIQKLKQEVKDSLEDRKIHEKKGASIVKDLKRQLQMERRRAEKLQEKLQEFLSESNQTRSVEVNAFKPPGDVGDRAETSSISSWSLMSGGQLESTSRDTQDGSHTGSLPNGNSPTPPSILEQENYDLLCRITSLQEEKWILEEKVNHLEQSNAAMADDIVRKQAVIQYYCMEGRADPHPHLNSDKLTVKRVVDFIKDKGDENQREINRKLLRTLEETLTKNMCLQKDLEVLSQEVLKGSKSDITSKLTSVAQV